MSTQAVKIEKGVAFAYGMDVVEAERRNGVVYVRDMFEGSTVRWRKAGKRQALTFRQPAPFLAAR